MIDANEVRETCKKSNLLDKRKRKYGPLLQWETELNTSPHWSVSTHACVHSDPRPGSGSSRHGTTAAVSIGSARRVEPILLLNLTSFVSDAMMMLRFPVLLSLSTTMSPWAWVRSTANPGLFYSSSSSTSRPFSPELSAGGPYSMFEVHHHIVNK